MFGILVFGFIMMVLTVFFWWHELKFYLDNMYRVKYSRFIIIQIPQRGWVFTVNFFRLFTDGKYFTLDTIITMASVSILGFGEGVTGGVLGLAFSNVVSAFLSFVMWRQGKRRKMEAAIVQ